MNSASSTAVMVSWGSSMAATQSPTATRCSLTRITPWAGRDRRIPSQLATDYALGLEARDKATTDTCHRP